MCEEIASLWRQKCQHPIVFASVQYVVVSMKITFTDICVWYLFKGTVARDFLVSLFFMDLLYMGPGFQG
jgi:hypothetical protein